MRKIGRFAESQGVMSAESPPMAARREQMVSVTFAITIGDLEFSTLEVSTAQNDQPQRVQLVRIHGPQHGNTYSISAMDQNNFRYLLFLNFLT